MAFVSPMIRFIDEFPVEVVSLEAHENGLFLLQLQFFPGKYHGQVFAPRAGEFIMAETEQTTFRFRKPYSLFYWDAETQRGGILLKCVGQGSTLMAHWQVGQRTTVIGSLGHGIPESLAASAGRTLLIGGGVGLAPLSLWVQQLQREYPERSSEEHPFLLYGTRTVAEAQPVLAAFPGTLYLNRWVHCVDVPPALEATDVWKGHPVHWLEHHGATLSAFESAIICGPNRMMQAAVRFLNEQAPHMQVYVSLENHMPCGTGACYGCVVGAASEEELPIKVCEQGPVLEANRIAWYETGPAGGAFALNPNAYPALSCGTGEHHHA
jgi:dihydroorotate dehydrogenase electron transfer subunit